MITPQTIFAPAKVNLYLHVTGRRDDGYHTLDSLITFADIGDQITLSPCPDFQFEIRGSYAEDFSPAEYDASPDSGNLVVRAAWSLAREIGKEPNIKIALTKNLPIASGLGGGSSDAASIIWGLMKYWDIPNNAPFIPKIMLELGADVPVCLECKPARILGIGEKIEALPTLPEIPLLLVNPKKACSTREVFLQHKLEEKDPIHLPEGAFLTIESFIDFLREQRNDLYPTARSLVPEIDTILNTMRVMEGCHLARLSGSGATCFGLFETIEEAHAAANIIQSGNPNWWIQTGFLNTPSRY